MAKAAFAGKAKSQSAGLTKGGGAGPQGSLRTLRARACRAGMPPKARAKGAAARAKAETAAAGKTKDVHNVSGADELFAGHASAVNSACRARNAHKIR